MKQTIAVLVQMDTNDPLLDPDRLDVSTPEAIAKLRAAVVRGLPGLTRVIAVLPLELAELMCHAHDEAMKASGLG